MDKKYAVIIDGLYGLCTESEATVIWGLLGDGPATDELADTPFGVAYVIRRAQPIPRRVIGPVDIRQYVIDSWAMWAMWGRR